ncbi:helix-turn-helix domain-containing protein [Actinomadura kijaniata]|uniref:helix-turn-helix domain-containing protein n=1 Tax=Actinomadura kijaniata TaxID=46161 RepID=UPI000835B42C|nr:helix-turn-helix transcriptional regulator [Actinomadura kijaniata]
MGVAEMLNPEDSLWHFMAVYLRKERHRRKLSLADVAKIIEADKSRVSNYEAGRLKITRLHAEAIDQAWGTMLATLRKFAVKLGLDADWAKQLWEFEDGALVIKVYVNGVVPVPFQTEGYGAVILELSRTVIDIPDAVRRRMGRRKQLLEQVPQMTLWALIDERALTPPGYPEQVVREQLEDLLVQASRPGISVRVIPDVSSVHVGGDGSFELITTAQGENVAYVWAQLGGRLVHDAPDVRELSLRYDRIGAKALTEEATRELIAQKLERLT